MITASLLLNIIVLIPVCIAFIGNFEKMQKTAGIFTPARGILLAMYITILVVSSVLLFFNQPKMAMTLFLMQIIYKFLSPFTVKTFKNPIVISNLFIAAFHSITVYSMLSSGIIEF